MKPNIIIETKFTIIAVFWDGSFKSVEAIEKAGIFEGIKVSFNEGHIAYFDHSKFEIKNCSRGRYILKDGKDIKEYLNVTNIQNDYPQAIIQNEI